MNEVAHNWEQIPLGGAATFVNGYAFKPEQWSDEGLEIIRIQNLTAGGCSTNYFQGEIPSKYKVRRGDLLISWSATLGIFIWDSSDAWLNQHIFKVVFDKKEFDKQFFKHLITSSLRKMGEQVHGATMKHITKKKFDAFVVPYPPLEEQKKIAAILDGADALRQKDAQLIAKYNALSQSLFLDMFGDFINTDLIPLKQLVKFSQGQQFPLEEQLLEPKDGYSRFLRIVDFTQGDDLRFVPNCHEKYFVKKDDIVIVRYGATAGFVGINKEGVLANNLFKVNFDRNQFHQLFLFFIFNHERFKAFLKKEAFGAAMPALSFKVMDRFEIPVPPITLQNQFAERIQAIEAQKQQAQTALQKSEDLFNSLLQRAFKGELTA